MELVAQVIIPILALLCNTFVAIIVAIIGVYSKRAETTIKKAETNIERAETNIGKISDNFPSWEVLYEHDENGNRIKGSIERLKEAVQDGYPIKVKIRQPNNSTHVMDAEWLFIEDNTVHGANTSQVSLTKNTEGNYVYLEDSYHYYVTVNSMGHHHATRVYIDGRKHKPTNSKRYMTWIGLVPTKV